MSKEDFFHCLYASTYFRVYPVTNLLPSEINKRVGSRIYLFYRQFAIFILALFPYAVIFWAIRRMFALQDSLLVGLIYVGFILPVLVLSISGSIARAYADKEFVDVIVREQN